MPMTTGVSAPLLAIAMCRILGPGLPEYAKWSQNPSRVDLRGREPPDALRTVHSRHLREALQTFARKCNDRPVLSGNTEKLLGPPLALMVQSMTFC